MKDLKQFYVSRDIHDEAGRVYIKGHQTITLNPVQISRIRRLGMWDYLVSSDDGIQEGKLRALQRYSDVLSQIEDKYSTFHIRGQVDEASKFITKLMCQEGFLHEIPYMNTLVEYSNWHYSHSIDVAVLSVILAEILGYDEKTIRAIAIGALMHEIGILFVDKAIITKQPEERTDAEQHLLLKSCELAALSVKCFNISEKSLKIIREHRECLDGSGGPNHLKGAELIDEVRLVSVVDKVTMETSRGAGIDAQQVVKQLYLSPQKYDRKFTSILAQLLKHTESDAAGNQQAGSAV